MEDCNFHLESWSSKCNSAMSSFFNRYEEIDIYNIYVPSCNLNKTSSSAYGITSGTEFSNAKASWEHFLKRCIFSSTKLWVQEDETDPGRYDPCYSTYAEAYFNKRDVQTALNVNSKGGGASVKWTVYSSLKVESGFGFTVEMQMAECQS